MVASLRMGWLVPIGITLVALSSVAALEIVGKWKYVDYEWEDSEHYRYAVQSGSYDPENIIIHDAQVLPDGRILVTTPRWIANNPASLSVVSGSGSDAGPLLQPYPDWAHHSSAECEGVTNVNRVIVDKCDRLWFVDDGRIGNKTVCPAYIYTVNPANDELLNVVSIPASVSDDGELSVRTIETFNDDCSSLLLYIADGKNGALVLYDGQNVWRLRNKLFEAVADENTVQVGDRSTFSVWGRGAINAVNPLVGGALNLDWVMFTSLASKELYLVLRDDLYNSKNDENIPYYVADYYDLPSHVTDTIVTQDGIIFSGLARQQTLACVSIKADIRDRSALHIFDTDAENLQYLSSAKVNGDELWVVSNRLNLFLNDALDRDDYNYRLIKINIPNLVSGTTCDASNNVRSQPTLSRSASKDEKLTEDLHILNAILVE